MEVERNTGCDGNTDNGGHAKCFHSIIDLHNNAAPFAAEREFHL